jgi:hypothetical protein
VWRRHSWIVGKGTACIVIQITYTSDIFCIYTSERPIAGWWRGCLGCMLCLMAETCHHFTHHSAHDYNTCTSLFKRVKSLQPSTYHTICQRSETQDPNPTYLRLLPHRPDEGRKSRMFQWRIRNRLQHHHAMRLPQRNGPCLLENRILTTIMTSPTHIKYLSDPERPERWV